MTRFDVLNRLRGRKSGRRMLERLDTVDWGTLRHAFGEATDIPGLIRSLLSADTERRQQTMTELFQSICHQGGTVYAATAEAVPFLYELLTNPEVPAKSDIAYLLASIADGRGYLEVHATSDLGQRTWRKILAEQGRSLEDELEREAAEVRSVRQAISVGLVHLIPYLRDVESEIRRSVAEGLGNYPEHAIVSVPALAAAAASEADAEVSVALRESIELLTKR